MKVDALPIDFRPLYFILGLSTYDLLQRMIKVTITILAIIAPCSKKDKEAVTTYNGMLGFAFGCVAKVASRSMVAPGKGAIATHCPAHFRYAGE